MQTQSNLLGTLLIHCIRTITITTVYINSITESNIFNNFKVCQVFFATLQFFKYGVRFKMC